MLATLTCITGLIATYHYFVQTTTGQFIDESALVEAVQIHGPAGKASTKFLDLLPTISLVMAAVVVLFVTVIRKRWTEAGIAVTACIGANIATQVLKAALPVRPDKGVVTLDLNSLPSGHTTLAASAAAAVFLMASPRWRPMAGFVGGSFAIASGVS
ncbi:MAG: superfamily protein, partial [Pseudarthrobacter sp.]|nr:superfamily protein [Pseudarthrobacter sp.]